MTNSDNIAKILSMIEQFFIFKTPDELSAVIVENLKQRRKEAKLTQAELGEKAGVSYGSIKRFEQTGEISLHSLLKIAIVLDCSDDFEQLFAKKHYNSIQEIIDEQNE